MTVKNKKYEDLVTCWYASKHSKREGEKKPSKREGKKKPSKQVS